MKRIYALFLTTAFAFTAFAQTPGGQAFRIDYDEFQSSGEIKHINCGNNAVLNPGAEFTVMCWMQLRDIGDNQKIVGKFNLDNTGFILGVDQGRVYAEVWNGNHYEPLDGLMNPLAQHWHHIAMTFTAGDALRTYINGVEAGSTPVSDDPIIMSDNDLILGVSSWTNLGSFQTFGNLDEIALYNVALTEEQIHAQMFKEHTGGEAGLMAGYTFNDASGTDVPDVSPNANTGVGSSNFSGSEWVDSWAPIADDNTEGAMDHHAVWNGLSFMDPRATSSTNGLNLVASGMDTAVYALFGHDGGTGLTTADIPVNAPGDFERAARIWPMTVLGSVTLSAVVNLEAAAGGGDALASGLSVENYTLLYRPAGGTTFVSIANGSTESNGVVSFQDVTVYSGDYSIGVGSAPIEPSGLYEDVIQDAISVIPNPSDGRFQIEIDTPVRALARIDVLDITGKVVVTESMNLTGAPARQQFDISGFGQGIYLIRVEADGNTFTQRVTVR